MLIEILSPFAVELGLLYWARQISTNLRPFLLSAVTDVSNAFLGVGIIFLHTFE